MQTIKSQLRPGFRLVTLVTLLMLTLAGCGGGGGGGGGSSMAAITAQPADQSVVEGTTASFSVTASNAVSYQWQLSTDNGVSFTDVAGATAAGYTTSATALADSGRKYRVVVSNSSNSVTSSAATLTVTAAPVAPAISVHPGNQTVIEGQNASFSVTASGTSLAYQWQRSSDAGLSFANLAGETGATLSRTSVLLTDNGQQFRVVVSNSVGTVTSNAATLTVNPTPVAPAFTTQPANQSVTEPATASFSVIATGTPAPTLQWQLSTDGVTWNDIVGATAVDYTTPATTVADSGKQYRAVATNSAGTVNSNAATLSVAPTPVAPSFSVQPANQSVTEPNTATFSVVAAGTPTPTLQWQSSADNGVNWSNIVGATGSSYTTSATTVTDSGKRYRAVASNGAGTVSSNAATLMVAPSSLLRPAALIVTAASSQNTLTWGSVTGATSYNIYWSNAPGVTIGGAGVARITGATSPYSHTGLSDGTTYYYVVTAASASAESQTSVETGITYIAASGNFVFTKDGSGTTTAMNMPRVGHCATLLPNGKVLLTGSMSFFGNGAELYDPATGIFSVTKNGAGATTMMTTQRSSHTSTLLPNGKVLLAGGYGPTSSAELYDPATGVFILTKDITGTTATMRSVRLYHTATLLPNGKVLLTGGVDNTWASLTSAELYDPVAGTFSLTTDGAGVTTTMKSARQFHTATLLPDGKVLLAGGSTTNSAELYDPATGTFTLTKDGTGTTSTMNSVRQAHTASLLPNGKVLLTGGLSTGLAYLSSAELYDPATGAFTVTRDGVGTVTVMNVAREYHTATLLPNGRVLIAGGYSSSGGLNSAELYDPATGLFALTKDGSGTGTTMNMTRGMHATTFLPNGRVLLTGGPDNSAELYW